MYLETAISLCTPEEAHKAKTVTLETKNITVYKHHQVCNIELPREGKPSPISL